MAFLAVDTYDDVQEFKLLDPGVYEVYAESRDIGQSPNTGTPYTEFVFVVRSDVEQPGKNRKIWHRFWHTEKTVGIVKGFLKQLGAPTGIVFDSQEEFANYCLLKPVKARIDIEYYEDKNGNKKMKNVIRTFYPTDYPGFQPGTAPANSNNQYLDNPFADDGKPIEIDDDDLPF